MTFWGVKICGKWGRIYNLGCWRWMDGMIPARVW